VVIRVLPHYPVWADLLWRFEVSHSAPSTIEEYQIAMNEAAAERILKKAATK
jgi:hypothetical protein